MPFLSPMIHFIVGGFCLARCRADYRRPPPRYLTGYPTTRTCQLDPGRCLTVRFLTFRMPLRVVYQLTDIPLNMTFTFRDLQFQFRICTAPVTGGRWLTPPPPVRTFMPSPRITTHAYYLYRLRSAISDMVLFCYRWATLLHRLVIF